MELIAFYRAMIRALSKLPRRTSWQTITKRLTCMLTHRFQCTSLLKLARHLESRNAIQKNTFQEGSTTLSGTLIGQCVSFLRMMTKKMQFSKFSTKQQMVTLWFLVANRYILLYLSLLSRCSILHPIHCDSSTITSLHTIWLPISLLVKLRDVLCTP